LVGIILNLLKGVLVSEDVTISYDLVLERNLVV
jgi:hypothetical protein